MNVSTGISLAGLGPSTGEKLDKTHADLKKAAQGFESYFVDQMLKEMRKSIPKDELLGDSDHQQEIFQDMSDQAVADSVSKSGSFGIGDMLYKELSKSLPPNNPAADTSAGAGASTGAVVPTGTGLSTGTVTPRNEFRG
jgi:Rod binding domain-containing protein